MLLIQTNGKRRQPDMFEKGWNENSFHTVSDIKETIGGEYSIIRLNDGRRLVIRQDQRKLPFNAEATRILRELSLQSEAEVYGIAVLCTYAELGRIELINKFTPEQRKTLSERMKKNHRYAH